MEAMETLKTLETNIQQAALQSEEMVTNYDILKVELKNKGLSYQPELNVFS
jgi:hypothetical protein